ncbi:hypothetical protein C1H46_005704 [Malus baccata]|uniref:pectinesterase n=1 Tax=Malus baccata TaxID=106549 RepID=A0A540NDY5_MALBA|nr:hypothetical protein C1H46_005704 [Malus baccata]
MDSVKSFKGYGKVDELEEQAFKRKTRKRLIILSVSTVVLLAVIIGVVAGVIIHKRNNSSPSVPNSTPGPELTPAASLKAVCGVTQYPSSCFSSISALETSNSTDPEVIFKLSLQVAIHAAAKLPGLPAKIGLNIANDTHLEKVLDVCEGLFEDVVDRLNDSLTSMDVNQGDKLLTAAKINDIKTWLSTTLTDQETCLDSLADLNSTLVQEFKAAVQNTTEFSSNSLAIVAKILSLLTNLNVPVHRRLLGVGGSEVDFPGWVSPGDRRLLQDNNATAQIVVAKDGTGDFKTIQEAVDKVPKKSKNRILIHVKQGVYYENVLMDKSKWNVMMFGDGKTKTVVSGNLSFVDGTPTFSTATFAVTGKGFIVKDMGFINTAGAIKHQAVAFRSEYQNSGPGSGVDQRVKWAGYNPTLTDDEAAKFTVTSLIQGGEWLPGTDVAFETTL